MDLTPLIGSLNPAQKDAVTAPPEHRLVLAGAGSGKTRVLVHRVAWLVAVENVSPHSVLAVTWPVRAGIGLRYYSSFGPIRIDVGVPLNRRKCDAPVAVAVSLGQAF